MCSVSPLFFVPFLLPLAFFFAFFFFSPFAPAPFDASASVASIFASPHAQVTFFQPEHKANGRHERKVKRQKQMHTWHNSKKTMWPTDITYKCTRNNTSAERYIHLSLSFSHWSHWLFFFFLSRFFHNPYHSLHSHSTLSLSLPLSLSISVCAIN